VPPRTTVSRMKATGTCVWPKKTDLCVLIRKTGGGGELVEDVTPAFRRVERGVDEGEVGDYFGVFEVAQPLAFLVGQLSACPVDGFGGGGVETFKRIVGGAVFVVVAFDARHVHFADDVEAFPGIGVVADNIADAGVVRDLLI